MQGLNINISALYLYDLLCELKEKINSFNDQDLIDSSLKFKNILDRLSIVILTLFLILYIHLKVVLVFVRLLNLGAKKSMMIYLCCVIKI